MAHSPTSPPGLAALPDLRIVPVAALLLHERHDAQRSEPLAQRLRTEQVLRNPPIVAAIGDGDGRFVVLDGANRVTAFERMGLPHVVVQVVDYAATALVLDCWHHLVCGHTREDFIARLAVLPSLIVEPAGVVHARAQLARREAIASVEVAGQGLFTVRAEGSLHQRVASLNDMVDLYRAGGQVFRVASDDLEPLLAQHDNATALVVFARHDPSEIVEFARIGAALPAGITRHVIPGRALRIEMPLSLLTEPSDLADKNAALAEWVRARVAQRQVRFYQESTFAFDE